MSSKGSYESSVKMNQINKQATVCAEVFLRRLKAESGHDKQASVRRMKVAIRMWPWLVGLGLVGGGAGLAYHKNQVRNAYTQGNRDLMAELRPLLAGMYAPRGGFDLPA